MPTLQPNRTRAKIVITLIVLILALDVLSFLFCFFLPDFIVLHEGASDELKIPELIALFRTLIYLISSVAFIRWFWRAYANLHLRVKILRFTTGWAAGAWFIPIISLFRPFQIMKDLYQKTNELLVTNNIEGKNLKMTFVRIWWGFWIINLVMDAILHNSPQFNAEFFMTAPLIDAILDLVTIKVISDYFKVEPFLNDCKDVNTLVEEQTVLFSSAASEPSPLN